MFKEKVTLQYPEEKPVLPPNYRGVPTLVKDPNGREKCVSCQLCEFVCPPKAIRITPGSVPEDQEDREHVEKAPQEFEINMLRCIYCGYCEEVCPEEAIFLQNEYSLSGYTRDEMINDKAKLYELGGTLRTITISGTRRRRPRRRATPIEPFAMNMVDFSLLRLRHPFGRWGLVDGFFPPSRAGRPVHDRLDGWRGRLVRHP